MTRDAEKGLLMIGGLAPRRGEPADARACWTGLQFVLLNLFLLGKEFIHISGNYTKETLPLFARYAASMTSGSPYHPDGSSRPRL